MVGGSKGRGSPLRPGAGDGGRGGGWDGGLPCCRGAVAGAALPLSGRCSGGIAASLVADGDVHIPIPAAVAVSPHVLEMEDDPGQSRQEQCHHKGHHGGEGAGSPGCRPRSHGTGPGSREGSRASARRCPAAALDPAQWAWLGLGLRASKRMCVWFSAFCWVSYCSRSGKVTNASGPNPTLGSGVRPVPPGCTLTPFRRDPGAWGVGERRAAAAHFCPDCDAQKLW